MNKRLLVLADINKDCSKLFEFASSFANEANFEMIILHQLIPVLPAMATSSDRNKIIEEATIEAIEVINKQIKPFLNPGMQPKVSVIRNDIPDEIKKIYSEEDILLLSLKEKSGFFKRILPGQTSLQVINSLKNIVICIPEDDLAINFSKCWIAVQKNNPLDIQELNRYLKITGGKVKNLFFFSVVTDDENNEEATAYLKELADYFSGREGIEVNYGLLEGQNVFESIQSLGLQHSNEFLIIQKGSRLFADMVFRKFLIKEIVHHAKVPLIVFG